jgi:hypothetical protein
MWFFMGTIIRLVKQRIPVAFEVSNKALMNFQEGQLSIAALSS